MKTRPAQWKAGNTAWIIRRENDGLGNALSHNEAVVIISIQGNWAFVRDRFNRQRRISTHFLDPGCEYQGRSGHWYSEDHSLVHRTLERLIVKLQADGGSEQEIERLQGILNRHPDVE